MLYGGKKNFPCPPAGAHSAICADVIYLKDQQVSFQGETKLVNQIEIRWFLDEMDEHGEPYRVQQRYTASLHEKAKLRALLEGWRGKAFAEAELEAGLDEETLVGQTCLLSIMHRTSAKGHTYANVASASRLPKGMTPMVIPNYYVRECDKHREQEHDDVPFGGDDDAR